jgi:hypothetical protein
LIWNGCAGIPGAGKAPIPKDMQRPDRREKLFQDIDLHHIHAVKKIYLKAADYLTVTVE